MSTHSITRPLKRVSALAFLIVFLASVLTGAVPRCSCGDGCSSHNPTPQADESSCCGESGHTVPKDAPCRHSAGGACECVDVDSIPAGAVPVAPRPSTDEGVHAGLPAATQAVASPGSSIRLAAGADPAPGSFGHSHLYLLHSVLLI